MPSSAPSGTTDRRPRCRRVVVAGLVVAALAPGGASATGGASPAPWWAGPEVAGLPLDDEQGTSVFYGTCEADSQGEGGCTPPMEIQTATSCGRNPVGLDVVPARLVRLPGGAIAAGETTSMDVGTGLRTLTIYAGDPDRARTALRQLRPRGAAEPVATLPPPRYPRAVLGELRRVVHQQRRTPGARATAKALGLATGVVRTRLRLADLLPADALRGIPVPRLSTAEVERRRQQVFEATVGTGRVSDRVRRSIRGLAGGC